MSTACVARYVSRQFLVHTSVALPHVSSSFSDQAAQRTAPTCGQLPLCRKPTSKGFQKGPRHTEKTCRSFKEQTDQRVSATSVRQDTAVPRTPLAQLVDASSCNRVFAAGRGWGLWRPYSSNLSESGSVRTLSAISCGSLPSSSCCAQDALSRAIKIPLSMCRQCNQDIEDNPDSAKAYLNRAICYMHLHNYEETLDDAMQSTKLNDASADAWYMLGQAHMGLGHYRAAISAFRRANQIDPANVHIRSAILQAEQILEEVQQGKYAQPTLSIGGPNAGRNTA